MNNTIYGNQTTMMFFLNTAIPENNIKQQQTCCIIIEYVSKLQSTACTMGLHACVKDKKSVASVISNKYTIMKLPPVFLSIAMSNSLLVCVIFIFWNKIHQVTVVYW